ncbi:hypothetical protein [Methylophilus aquaticus]|uniref:Uncharacterized protein n=1 Tax=Methylophilus aquaticus TaxID=1971610 RepID=A0ABT9JSM9_9PROT|nr:hypothetical protein [Methylophilus aquaticus]MDP8567597.1 hypothetical protein [Methylophilus aquaticus]
MLCLLPVQLNMQRDSFSLQGIVPLSKAHYQQLTVQISEHFAKDFILHTDPDNRFWWVQPLQTLEVECPWPQSVLFQQAFAWQPTGRGARVLRQWVNECQMLMHQIAHHADASWPATLNSLWFSNVAQLPSWQHRFDLISGQGRLLEGLTASGLSAVRALKIAELASGQRYKHALFVADSMRDVDWESLSVAFSKGIFTQLKIMLPFAECSVHITLKRGLRWCFWRKPRPMDSLLQALHESLLSQPKSAQGVR